MKLNEKTEKTVKNIHLLTTTLCLRNCPLCCNKQIDLNEVPYVTEEELSQCENLFITGGEPVIFCNVGAIAHSMKANFKNIKNVFVYANMMEFSLYVAKNGGFLLNRKDIAGYTLSVKTVADVFAFNRLVQMGVASKLENTRIYVYGDWLKEGPAPDNLEVFHREWQKDFVPAPDSIFRKI